MLNTNKVPINVSIKVENDTDMKRGIITYVSTNIEDWDNFLKFLEKNKHRNSKKLSFDYKKLS